MSDPNNYRFWNCNLQLPKLSVREIWPRLDSLWIRGSVAIDNVLTVIGSTVLSSLSVTGTSTMNNLNVSGTTTLTGGGTASLTTITVSGATALNGTTTINGITSDVATEVNTLKTKTQLLTSDSSIATISGAVTIPSSSLTVGGNCIFSNVNISGYLKGTSLGGYQLCQSQAYPWTQLGSGFTSPNASNTMAVIYISMTMGTGGTGAKGYIWKLVKNAPTTTIATFNMQVYANYNMHMPLTGAWVVTLEANTSYSIMPQTYTGAPDTNDVASCLLIWLGNL